ncbi:MurR/RpiR family transcriptional regulator [Schumannella luteola]|uniref:DNA-binding MurR/RpiR family transcriptional regulator n=1 Tax=Schumannella luteola TaxID=472059 RepID=A0A852YAH5_9MICO|nr:MurR/RpiR family transcriptional regulator [Schumannella luteola]NYG99493.1 DNA-binding MurR/RpiR family transcriptional regulator [Schumannella luteola]TPX03819.1 MurR/RpiR family transcriptional regulator [Schumannella luteola]
MARADTLENGFRAAARIRANLPQMSAAMAKIGELVLADPTAALELSITELADRAGTSAATVTRFCRLLGYPGFAQFRLGLVDGGAGDEAQETWRVDIGRQFAPDDSPSDVLRTLLSVQSRALEATASLIDLELVTSIAQSIWSARHLDIYGVGGSWAVANELHSRLYRIGIDCHAWGEPHSGLVSAEFQDEHCVAIGISTSGRTAETVDMLARAAASGARTVAITSDRDSALARAAEACITTASPDVYLQPTDLAARPSQLLVLDLIYLLVAQQDFTATATRLTRSRLAVSGHRRVTSSPRGPRIPRATTGRTSA